MDSMHSVNIQTKYGEKSISVFSCDIAKFDEKVDILTVSAFEGCYAPSPQTVFAALDDIGIDVEALAESPEIDLRKSCNMWISKKLIRPVIAVGRIACVEMSRYADCLSGDYRTEKEVISLIKAYFSLLDLISASGVEIETVAMPLLGAGKQQISPGITIIPIINECIEFLKRNEYIKNFYFVDSNQNNAFKIAMALEKSYVVHREKMFVSNVPASMPGSDSDLVFISYSSNDKIIADNLCERFETSGKKVWYAPRNIDKSDYATAIVDAIGKSSHFVVIISHNSMQSEHVLNEIDLAFKELGRGIKYHPLRLDEEELRPAFSYYLSRQHWTNAYIPPREQRIEEFVCKIVNNTF